jgi:hypothetical protein
MLWKAWTDRGLIYSIRGRIFNNVLHVRYLHLTKETNPSSRQKAHFIRTMTTRVKLEKVYLVVILKGLQDELMCGKPPVVK